MKIMHLGELKRWVLIHKGVLEKFDKVINLLVQLMTKSFENEHTIRKGKSVI